MDFTELLTNFSDKIATGLPNIIGALIILLIGWLIAKGVSKLITKVISRTSLNNKYGKGNTGAVVGKLFYYLLMVIVLLIVLEKLGIQSVLTPLEEMVNEFLSFIPNLIAAGVIAFVGYMIAKIVSGLVGGAASFIGKYVDKLGLETEQVVKVLKTVVFIVIFIPLLIQAINALEMHSIGDPLNEILSGFIGIIGNVIVAAVILGIFVWLGKLLTNFLKSLMTDLGVDNLAAKLKIDNLLGNMSLSKLIAGILYFFIVFFGVVTALNILQLEQLTDIMHQILDITGSIVFGAVIIAIGAIIANLISNALSGKNKFVGTIVKIAVIGLFLGMGLRAMGIANEIVNLAFGLTLGSLAVVVALAYGLGGREAAGEHFKEIIQKLKGKDDNQNQ